MSAPYMERAMNALPLPVHGPEVLAERVERIATALGRRGTQATVRWRQDRTKSLLLFDQIFDGDNVPTDAARVQGQPMYRGRYQRMSTAASRHRGAGAVSHPVRGGYRVAAFGDDQFNRRVLPLPEGYRGKPYELKANFYAEVHAEWYQARYIAAHGKTPRPSRVADALGVGEASLPEQAYHEFISGIPPDRMSFSPAGLELLAHTAARSALQLNPNLPS